MDVGATQDVHQSIGWLYDARNRESKVLLGLIVMPLAVWFFTWLVSRFL